MKLALIFNIVHSISGIESILKRHLAAYLLLTAVTVSFGAATTPSAVAQESTMADTYDPYFEPIEAMGSASIPLQSDKPLPKYTALEIVGLEPFNCFENDAFYIDNGVELRVWGTNIEAQDAWPSREQCSDDRNQYHGWSPEFWEGWEDVTFAASPTVLVHYPDGSVDTTKASIKFQPEYSLLFAPTYGDDSEPENSNMVIEPGQTKSIELNPNPDPYHPDTLTAFPEGTTFELEYDSYTYRNGERVPYRPIVDQGGSVQLNPNTGEVTVNIPVGYSSYEGFGKKLIRVNVKYPAVSGVSSMNSAWLSVNVIKPTPKPTPQPPKSTRSSFVLSSSD